MVVSVLQKLFHHPIADAAQTAAPAVPDEKVSRATGSVEPDNDLAGYVGGVEDSLLHDPGEPPHWAPECGTPSFSTRHRPGP